MALGLGFKNGLPRIFFGGFGGLGFRVWGLGFRVWCSKGFRV